MSVILPNTGAKLWDNKDDYDLLWLDIYDLIVGAGGKSDIRLIDEAIGKINESLSGYYFKIINSKLYICKDDESGTTSIPVAIIDAALSSTSENAIQNKIVTAKFNEVDGKVSANEATIQSHTTALSTLNGEGEGSVKKAVSDGIAKVVADAPESLNTLKEISDWISSHESDASAMNSAIQTNKTDIATLKTDKVDKETGKNLLADTDKANYDDAVSKAHTHSNEALLNKLGQDSNGALTLDGGTVAEAISEEFIRGLFA